MTKSMLLILAPMLGWSADISGQWNFHLVRFGEEFAAARVELKAEGTKLTGTLNELKLEGTVDSDRVHITAKRGEKDWGKLDGQVSGDQMEGTVKQGSDEFNWKASRIKVSSAPPKTHVFEPTQFHRAFSGTIAPALRINPGDTVRTTTVDAGGTDAKGVRRSMGGNPETGPFFVEGA